MSSLRTTKKVLTKFTDVINTPGFYYAVIGFFVFESIWIAFSALYPQAFDENFHFGLIKVYSHYWLPFLSHQPPDANAYGAVARDPSYLYHYLMSFPYRLMALFIHSQTAQVIGLRLMDIGLVVVGLQLFRKVLRRAGLSKGLTNISILIFVLIPIVPQLAAQVSYDDLLIPLVAWLCLQTFTLIDQIKTHKLSSVRVIVFLSVGILAGLEKYAFLPIFLMAIVFLCGYAFVNYRPKPQLVLKNLWQDYRKRSVYVKVLTVILLVVALGMFAERDGVNLVKYHKVEPNCAKVLSVKECKPYSAWYADYARHEYLLSGKYVIKDNFPHYVVEWFYWMWYRLFFAVNGPTYGFKNYRPLPVPSLAAAYLAAAGLISLIKWRRQIFKDNPYLVFLFCVAVFYCLVLFAQGYVTYRYTAVLENMNGRYLLPILLPLAAVLGTSLRRSLHQIKLDKAVVALIVLVLFFEGGGLFTFILRSDNTWYWDNKTVVKVNNTAKKVVKHVVVKGR